MTENVEDEIGNEWKELASLMDKTVTANFASVDLATFAAKNVTDHFGSVKKIKLTYDRPHGDSEKNWFTSGYFLPYGPYGMSGQPAGIGSDPTTNGVIPAAVMLANNRHSDQAVDNRKAKLSITAPENVVRQIESTLHTGGGLGIRIS